MDLKNKKIPSDLKTVGQYIAGIGGTYMFVAGHLVKYQSKSRGLNIEIEIESLKENNDFNASFRISSKDLKNLSALSKGKQDVTFSGDETTEPYLITNKHSTVKLDRVDVNLMMPTIEESIEGVEKIGLPVDISSRHVLGLTGREKKSTLVVRNNIFTGIINSAGEYFFDADHRKEAGVERLLINSYFFLKIGKDRFKLRLNRKKNHYLLLTEVSIGIGINCKILETLTKL